MNMMVQELLPAGEPLFLQILHPDIRFQIYEDIVLLDADETRVYDILDPRRNAPYPLTVCKRNSKLIFFPNANFNYFNLIRRPKFCKF